MERLEPGAHGACHFALDPPVDVVQREVWGRVWDLRLGIRGLGFGVWGLGFGVWGLGFEVWGLGFGVWGLGFGVRS